MKLKLHALKDTLSLSFSDRDAWLRDVFTRMKLAYQGPVSFSINLSREKEDIFVEGRLVAALQLNCSRCAGEMVVGIDEFFSPILVHGKEPVDSDGNLKKGEIEVTYFQRDEIDLAEILHEQLALALPLQPVCKVECRGLCAQCGGDMNQKECGCKQTITHSAFDVLKKIKIHRKGG